jgi:two-component system sensor histidine kinase KdpD
MGVTMTPGKLKVFLGYAAGVGKTWKMLDEALELRRRGVDVVLGYFEPHRRQDTIEKARGLEMVPRSRIVHRGATFEEMDTGAILRRAPRVCAVDELAHQNVPGSARDKRWQDVEVLRAAGIDVMSTLNVQHLESLNDEVWRITGIRVRETVPDWVVDRADEVVMVDLTPEALRNRLQRGVVYGRDKAMQAMENFFTEPNLRALRELALRHTAHDVEERISVSAGTPPSPRGPAETILICITGRPTAAMLIRRGKRVADYLGAACLALHVEDPNCRTAEPDRPDVARHLGFARNLRIQTQTIQSADVARAIVEFARSRHVTQIFLGRPDAGRGVLARRTTVYRIVAMAKDMEVTIVAAQRR